MIVAVVVNREQMTELLAALMLVWEPPYSTPEQIPCLAPE